MQFDCQNCGAPKVFTEYQDVFRCDHCGTVHMPAVNALDGIRILDARSEEACSLCRVQLHHGKADQWPVLRCPECAGLLIDSLTFWRVVKYRRMKKEDPFVQPAKLCSSDLHREVDCPKCQGTMIAHPYYGPGRFVIDFCSTCSAVWLDRGELGKAVNTEHTARW